MAMVRVEPSDLERKAAQLTAPLPAPPSLPLPADGLAIARDGLSLLVASAQRLATQISAGDVEATRLSQSFTAAAKSYRQIDEQAAAVLNSDAPATALEVGAPFRDLVPRTAAASNAGPGTRPSASFIKVEDAARQLQESDHGASLTAYADAWVAYAGQLEARAAAFTPSGIDWDSAAATNAFGALDKHHQWLLDVADAGRKVASQAAALAAAHNSVLGEHPTLQEVLDVLNKIVTDPDNREYWIELYRLLQRLCEELLEKYAKEADLEDVETPDAPSGTPEDSGKEDSPQPKEETQEPAAEQSAEQPAGEPQSESPSGSSPPGGGSGGGSEGSGSSGGGLPSGGLPTGEEGQGLPELPDDVSTLPAAADAGGGSGGGGAGGGGGGGLGPSPLSGGPSVGGVAVGPAQTQGGAPAAVPAAAASGGMGGGMGGMAPMHGGQGQGAKDKQRTPGTAPDEDLYTEDRPWTESVIGMPQSRRAGDGKGGK